MNRLESTFRTVAATAAFTACGSQPSQVHVEEFPAHEETVSTEQPNTVAQPTFDETRDRALRAIERQNHINHFNGKGSPRTFNTETANVLYASLQQCLPGKLAMNLTDIQCDDDECVIFFQSNPSSYVTTTTDACISENFAEDARAIPAADDCKVVEAFADLADGAIVNIKLIVNCKDNGGGSEQPKQDATVPDGRRKVQIK